MKKATIILLSIILFLSCNEQEDRYVHQCAENEISYINLLNFETDYVAFTLKSEMIEDSLLYTFDGEGMMEYIELPSGTWNLWGVVNRVDTFKTTIFTLEPCLSRTYGYGRKES